MPEHGAVYEGLTADEYIEMAGKVRGLDQATIEGRAHRILSHFDLHDARSPRAGPSCDDPSTLGGLAAGMLVALGYVGFFLIEPTLLESLPSPSGKVPTRSAFTFFLGALMLPLITLPSLVYSSDARAIWSLAAANLEPRRVVRAQRGVARATSLLPLTAALLLVHAKAGTGLLVAVADAALIWLVWELVGGAVQLLYPVMPFSRPREGRGEELLPFFLLIMPTFVMLAVWTAGVYDLVTFSLGKVITLAALAGGLLRLHRKIDEGIAVRGLPVELAPRVNRAA